MADQHKSDKEKNEESKTKKAAPEASKKTAKAASEAKGDKPAKAAKADKAGKAPKGPSVKRAPLAPKTYFAKNGETPEQWRLIDATGLTLGRLSSYIAMALMGKDKPTYTPFSDTGDHVVVINCEKVRLTGNKLEGKKYNYHTNYPGGIKEFTARELLEKHPERVIKWAVYGMLPKAKGHMARHWYGKLRVYAGPNHPHTAQLPKSVQLPQFGTTERT
jgi:large subunit ribosomal protein L13